MLLNCILPGEWRAHDDYADFGIKPARDLLIELVGDEPARQLREQFS